MAAIGDEKMEGGPGLLEREGPTAQLTAALTGAERGRGSVQLILGPAGIGKTSLLELVGARGRERGFTELAARASELETGFAFGLVHQLLEPVVYGLGEARRERLFAGAAARARVLFGGEATAGEAEYGVLSGLFWLVANLAEQGPLLIRVDDLHWADRASLRFLEFFARRLGELPVLLALTARPREPGAPAALLGALAAQPEAARIELGSLSEDAVGALFAAALGRRPDAGFTAAALAASGGNPLLVSVLAREAAARGMRGEAREGEALGRVAAPGLAPTVVRRLEALGEDAVAVARAAAVLGERAPFAELATLAELDHAAAQAALAALAEAQIFVPGTCSFAHPLVREAVLASIARPRLDRLHRGAALLLRARGARPGEIAAHWLARTPGGDPDAVPDLRAAADEAAAEGATAAAVDLLRRLLEEIGAGQERDRLRFELAELELRLLLPEGPERMRAALAARPSDEREVRGRAALGGVLLLRDPEAAVAEIEIAERAAAGTPAHDRLEATMLEALVFVEALAPRRRRRFAAIRAARDPSPTELAHLAFEEALAGAAPGRVVELAGRAEAGGELLRRLGPGGPTPNLLAHAFRLAERPEPVRRLLAAGDAAVRADGLLAAGAFVDQVWGYWHRDFGSPAAGLARVETRYEQIREADLGVSAAALAAIRAELLVLLDRSAEASTLIEPQAGAVAGTFIEAFVLSARGLTRAAGGRLEAAEHDLRQVVAILAARGWTAPAGTWGRARLAAVLVARGRPAEAAELAAADVAAARAAGTAGALGAALRVRALSERGERRAATLREAVDLLAESPLRLELGRALLELGASLRRAGKTEAARRELRRALDLASRIEATRLARRTREELAASGARPRRERLSGSRALTPSERRVAGMASEGMTNREIAEALWISPKTVEFHLGNVYSKLGVRSRGELGSAAEILG